MFLNSNSEMLEGRVSVLGEFVKIEGSHVVLRLAKGTINVLPKDFENYKTKYLLVTGIMENNVLIQEHVQNVEDDFEFDLFLRISKQFSKYPEVF